MEATIVYWGSIGIMENRMEATIVYRSYVYESLQAYCHSVDRKSASRSAERLLRQDVHMPSASKLRVNFSSRCCTTDDCSTLQVLAGRSQRTVCVFLKL